MSESEGDDLEAKGFLLSVLVTVVSKAQLPCVASFPLRVTPGTVISMSISQNLNAEAPRGLPQW